MTGADVAASTNATGNVVLGGDWILEASSGSVNIPALQVPDYQSTLSVSSIGTGLDGLNGNVLSSLGESATYTYGQTFYAPSSSSNLLNSFTMWVDPYGPGNTRLQGYLATWTGDRIGTVLWNSVVVDVSASLGMTQETFSGINVVLNPNQKYVFLLTASNVIDGIGDAAGVAFDSNQNSYTQGELVFYNNSSFVQLASQPWQ